MTKFPSTPSFTGANKPERWEADIVDLEIEGAVPTEINGAFYRVQPDPQFPPRLGDDIAFNGDGQVSMFTFRNGKIDFKHRWVQTDKWKLEHEAEKALFGAYRNPLTDDPSVKGRYRGTANTNVLTYAGRLLALKEDSPPVAMNPTTLETYGYDNFDGTLKTPTFTAHPKIDPETGEMIAFCYAANGVLTRDMAYFVISPEGKVTRDVRFEVPYYCMMHDFGVTRDYAVFHVIPIVSSWDRLEKGMPHFGFDTTREIYLGVLPRDGEAKDMRWFKAPNCFASHVMNAFNDGAKIYFDTPVAPNNMFPFFPDVHGKPFNPMQTTSRLTRWCVDMNSNGESFHSAERLTELSGEFPRIDERYAMAPYRHGYEIVMDDTKPFDMPGGRSNAGLVTNTLAHFDFATGKEKSWFCGPKSTLQEVCFIPKSEGAAEGEGYLTQVCNRLDERRSDLLVFDAQRVDEGPIAIAKLPLRLRFGLHGNWTPAVAA